MQKLGNISEWSHLKKGEFIPIPASASRRATIEFISPDPVGLWYYPLQTIEDINQETGKKTVSYKVDKKGSATFLSKIDGSDEIQFRSLIGVAIVADGPVSFKTQAGLQRQEYEATESFTQIIERRSVNPELAQMRAISKLNQQRHEREMQELRALMMGANGGNNQSTSDTSNDGSSTQSQSDDDQSASDTSTQSPDKGEQGADDGT